MKQQMLIVFVSAPLRVETCVSVPTIITTGEISGIGTGTMHGHSLHHPTTFTDNKKRGFDATYNS
jgi:hypothetical protein